MTVRVGQRCLELEKRTRHDAKIEIGMAEFANAMAARADAEDQHRAESTSGKGPPLERHFVFFLAVWGRPSVTIHPVHARLV